MLNKGKEGLAIRMNTELYEEPLLLEAPPFPNWYTVLPLQKVSEMIWEDEIKKW